MNKLYLTRNKSGSLVLWFNKPVKQGDHFYSNDGYFILDSIQDPDFGEVTPFPEVTFENSPMEVELKLVTHVKDEAKRLR